MIEVGGIADRLNGTTTCARLVDRSGVRGVGGSAVEGSRVDGTEVPAGDTPGNFRGVPKTLSGAVGGLMGPWSCGVLTSPSAPGEVSEVRTGEAARGALTTTAGDGRSSTTWSLSPNTVLKTSF